MILYRLEGPVILGDQKSPRGIFSSDRIYTAMRLVALRRGVSFEDLDSPYKHPEPSEDVGIGNQWGSKHFCAFVSLEQMRDWFRDSDVLQELNNLGCRLVTYEVSTNFVLHGKYQVVFEKEMAVELSRQAIPIN